MFRTAKPEDFPALAALWEEAFGDCPDAVARFYEAFPRCRCYAAETDGQVVSMVNVLPQTLSPDLPAAYVYAVATAQTHRNRGLCRALMSFAEEDLQQQGFACTVLTPGEPELFRFYEKLGYEAAFTRNRTVFPGGVPVSIGAYAVLREQILTVPHMVYDLPTLEYAAKAYSLTFYQTETGIAAAGEHYTAEVLPEDVGGKPFAMVKWLTEPKPLQNAYLGLALE